MNMNILIDLLNENQSFLMKRILKYAKLHGYTQYTSTLEEAWAASIIGLSESIINGILNDPKIPEIEVDQDFSKNIISSFGVIEAKKHRSRGITLEMFLSLMKYYRQAYLDLITESILDMEQKSVFDLWMNRFFDQNEISYIYEWNLDSKETIMSELQSTNRSLTNEKNKYLTIFESISTAAVFFDEEHRCMSINYAAQRLLQGDTETSGYIYYSDISNRLTLSETMPWLLEEYTSFCNGNVVEISIEKTYDSPKQGKRNLVIKFQKMLDVSNKFEGTVIIFNDMTEYKKIEEQLRYISFHDHLTGLYNRAYMEEEIARLTLGTDNIIGCISIDVDGLKIVNDNLGHNAGDMLLLTVSQIIKECFVENESIYRLGGDEFGILIPSTDVNSTQEACQRIRDNINLHNRMNFNLPLSISLGCCAGTIQTYNDIYEIIKEADGRMYEDKRINHAKYVEIFERRLKEDGKKLFR